MLPCGALLWWAFWFPSTSNGLFFLGTLRAPAGNLALAIHKNPVKTGPAQYKLAKKQAWDKNRVREECKHARLSKNLVLNRRGLPSMYSLNWRLMNNISLIFQVKLMLNTHFFLVFTLRYSVILLPLSLRRRVVVGTGRHWEAIAANVVPFPT